MTLVYKTLYLELSLFHSSSSLEESSSLPSNSLSWTDNKKKKKLLKIPPKKTSGACKWHFYQSHRRVENTIPRCVPPSSPSPLPLHKRSRWVPACHCGRVLASQWEAHHLNHPEETDGTDSTPVQKICRNKKAEKWQLFQSLIIIK